VARLKPDEKGRSLILQAAVAHLQGKAIQVAVVGSAHKGELMSTNSETTRNKPVGDDAGVIGLRGLKPGAQVVVEGLQNKTPGKELSFHAQDPWQSFKGRKLNDVGNFLSKTVPFVGDGHRHHKWLIVGRGHHGEP